MKVKFAKQFYSDIRNLPSGVSRALQRAIEDIERSKTLGELREIKKMRGYASYYRLRLGQYRLGLKYEGGECTLLRFLHRREIYRHFP